ncbi:MAG: TetR/AcrR family transcriptional regulator [Clostridiales bacterium]|nr:TetR/AcrR family transcriptional regulator [Clostridiales bacterium]
MPKVNAAYFENKRNTILDAVENICKVKPLYKLTMKDIIEAAGLSTGAVYAAFSDIDEVLIAFFNRFRKNLDFAGDTGEILQSQNPPEGKLQMLFRYFLEHARTTVESYGKINYEMSAVITDVHRRKKILAGIQEKQHYAYGINVAIELIEDNLANGYFKASVSKESIYVLIISFFDGIMRDLTLTKCYGIDLLPNTSFEEIDLAEALSTAVLSLLSINREGF